jgi:hypothetical protein
VRIDISEGPGEVALEQKPEPEPEREPEPEHGLPDIDLPKIDTDGIAGSSSASSSGSGTCSTADAAARLALAPGWCEGHALRGVVTMTRPCPVGSAAGAVALPGGLWAARRVAADS